MRASHAHENVQYLHNSFMNYSGVKQVLQLFSANGKSAEYFKDNKIITLDIWNLFVQNIYR